MTTVLVVDDRAVNRAIARATLEDAGYDVVEAHDGHTALDIAQQQAPDLVLTDIVMPGMDGHELVHQLRSQPSTAQLPILFFTANYDEAEIRETAYKLGVADVVAKNQTSGSLLDAVSKALQTPPAAVAEHGSDHVWDLLRTVNTKLLDNITARSASDARFRAIADAAPVGMVYGDGNGALYANPALTRLTERTREQLLGNGWTCCLRSENLSHARHLTIGAAPIAEDQRYEKQEILLPSGSTRWMTVTIANMSDDTGAPAGFVAVVDDVSTDIIAERERAQHQKERDAANRREVTERFASLARLASGVAHDMNNILNIILSYSTFVTDAVTETIGNPLNHDSAHHILDDLDRITSAAKRAAHLGHQMLTIGGREIVEPEIIDTNAAMREIGAMVPGIIGDDITIDLNLTTEAPHALIDGGRLAQILLNLVVNARDAMPDGGKITLQTTTMTAEQASRIPGIAAVPHVRLSVTDTGTGMTPEIAKKALDPFFTTKEAGKGTGLGLATSYGLIKQADGELVIRTEPGAGTTVDLFLPALHGSPHDGIKQPQTVENRGSETVLVVDDEPDIRTIVERVLRRAGYNVLTANDGAAALTVAGENYVDAVITDVVMPNMDGGQLAQALENLNPELPILFMSGYAAPLMTEQGILQPGAQVISKPFKNDDILAALRARLDAAHTPT